MKYLLGITFSFLFLVACNTAGSQADDGTTSTAKVVHMTPQEFQSKMSELSNPQIVDVRTAGELASEGFIESATNIDIKSADFGEKVSKLNKDQPILVYCAAGGRSKRACNSMKDWGFTEIYELDNGFGGWKSAGMPIKQ